VNSQEYESILIEKEKIVRYTFVVAALLALSVGGCSTYKPRNEGFGKMGYEETKLEDGTYILSYYGSSFDDEKDVKKKWEKRASELCGADKFKSDVSAKEWAYDGYVVLLPLIFKSKGASPLVEGKLKCIEKDI
jgi:hypothetical protein